MKKKVLAVLCAATVGLSAVPAFAAETTAEATAETTTEAAAETTTETATEATTETTEEAPVVGLKGDAAVVVNGEAVVFTTQAPVIKNDITLIPVRGVLEALGVTVVWDKVERSVTMTSGDKVGVLVIGDATFKAGDKEVELAAPAQIINGSTMIPLRAVAEYFGATVTWDAATRTVDVATAAVEETPAADAATETPAADAATETPAADAATETPATDAAAETPAADAAK